MSGYLAALGVTLACEVPVVAAWFPGQRRRMAVACALATTLTHLLMHFALPLVFTARDSWLLAGEALALFVEAAIYAVLSRDLGRALVASALANALSYTVGTALLR